MTDQPELPPYHHQPLPYAEPTAPDGRPLAGPGQRLGARIIDTVIYFIGGMILSLLAGFGLAALLSSVVDEDSPVFPAVGVPTILLIVLGVLYVIDVEIPLRWNGQTPGKRLLKIAVIPLEPGATLTRKKLAGRFGVMLAGNLLSNCFVGLLDPLWCLWDQPYRQCLHDKPPMTAVVRVDPTR